MKVAMLALSLCACGSSSIPQINPTPNVLRTRSTQTLALSLGADVAESPRVDGAGPVGQWRETLTNGFRNGLQSFFVRAKNDADLTLVFREATPSLEKTGVDGYRGHVRYRAELVDRGDKTVKTWDGTTTSRLELGTGDADIVLRSAVEVMYEEIAKDLPASGG